MGEDILIPYMPVFIDASAGDFLTAVKKSIYCPDERENITKDLAQIFTTNWNPNLVLPCLSIRTGLDLYLRVMNFPPGSEVIMSAINIPDMVAVVRHHGIKVVPLDVSIDSCGPKVDLIDDLVTDKTVAILVAHIYGKWFDMRPIIEAARKHKIVVLEDCAEVFSGFHHLGNVQSDVAFFSFGVIKYSTAFGGAILKIQDRNLYEKMRAFYAKYPVRSSSTYLKKVLKYSVAYLGLNCPNVIAPALFFFKKINVDPKVHVVKMLRGFSGDLIGQLRFQPSTALLFMLRHRLARFDPTDANLSQVKGDYVSGRLPATLTQVGTKAKVVNYWLFPVLVDSPDEILKFLNDSGVEAYRGATQLNIIEPTNGSSHMKNLRTFVTRYPHEAKFLIDHAIYLPVHKNIPFYALDKICESVQLAVNAVNKQNLLPKVKIQSKL